MTDLAKGKTPADRERLLMAMVDLCEGVSANNPSEISAAQAPLGALFMNLVVEAERDVRQRLAERIADVPWAPAALVHVLAMDEIEIARPVIASSPLFHDKDLVQLLVQATIDHQIEVARRERIGATVVEAIIERGDPLVMTALAGNETADIQPAAMSRLVDASRHTPAMRAPLSRHPRLTPELAGRMYAWVGDALKSTIASRFQIDEGALEAAVADTVRDLTQPSAPATPFDREAMERRLVEKLHDAGQLRPGYLLRALREGKLTLFQAALAKLGGLSPVEAEACLASDTPDLLALACLAAGIDRSVFPSILNLTRQLNRGLPGETPDSRSRYNILFNIQSPDRALSTLRQTVGQTMGQTVGTA